MTISRGKIINIRPSRDSDALKSFGASLKDLRELSRVTQAEMAKRLEVSRTTISKIENGGENVRVSTVQKYVKALGGAPRFTAAFPSDSALFLRMLDAFEIEVEDENQLVFSIFGDELFPPDRDVVLSIHPKYTSRILAGEKTVELRRRFPVSAPKGTIVYIYSTSPERAMVGYAELAGVHRLDVEEIWQRYANAAYIERAGFHNYFDGLDQGVVLELANARPFTVPLSLSTLREQFDFEPPQSFLYAKRDLRKALRNAHTIVSH